MRENKNHTDKVAVIGGGAAGFFAAINVKVNYPKSKVVLYEKTSKLLSKVRISGGGRCNVTNGVTSIKELCKGYPRGTSFMKKALHVFNTTDTRDWFESRKVPLKLEADGRVFPVSDNSSSIVDCLFQEAKKRDVHILTKCNISELKSVESGILVCQKNEEFLFDKVIVATGGSPKRSGFDWLERMGHKIENPVPSLFTFNMPNEPIKKLMGVVAENASVSIQGTKLQSVGPVLITHWGMSGPAILKLSSFGARTLAEKNYQYNVRVNWVNVRNDHVVFEYLKDLSKTHSKKIIRNVRPFDLPERLWLFLISKGGINDDKLCQDLGKKAWNKLTTLLTNDLYEVRGKTTFKEEFVTCGGVSLESINLASLESKVCPNLYFAGEVMDVDGITGGYNFQAAWATGFIAGKLL